MHALSGIKVLDLTRFVAGPYCTALLGDFGADVVKIEHPRRGDDTRHFGGRMGDESAYYLSVNRNKRSVALDPRDPEGQATLLALASEADVLVENYRPGVLEAMGLAPAVLHELNPSLVITRVSGFGQDGPEVARTSFDSIAQAESGLLAMTGGDTPIPTGAFVVDYTAGMQAAFATMVALFERTTSGRGQVVDVSLLEAAFSLMLSAPTEYKFNGTVVDRVGTKDRFSAPSGLFRVADGWVIILIKGNDEFDRLARAMGMHDLVIDERYLDNDLRMTNRETLDPVVANWTRDKNQGELVRLLREWDVLCAPVNDVSQAVDHPQLLHRNAMVEVEHPGLGRIEIPGVVAKLSRSAGSVRLAPPILGADTAQVLDDWLGVSVTAPERLR